MRKCGGMLIFVCMAAAMLSGCGTDPLTAFGATTVVVEKGGGLTYCLVEDFEKEYYDLQELEAMARKEAADFNSRADSGGKDAVTVKKVELLPGDPARVSVVYQFEDSGSFSEFTGSSFFYGTVGEAVYREGYDLQNALISVKDGKVQMAGALLQDGKKMLIVTDVKAVFYFPSGVSCLSGGLSLSEDGRVDATDAEGLVYILLK